ncbi:MAG TPA: hypothetical protein IAA30_04280 [Candidatus Treponema faecavium]|nr:hypothetical protein [Candidatus Treponema faecavium]
MFIDSDTVVCGDLSELTDITQAPISAVYDLHTTLETHPKKNSALMDLKTVHANPDISKGYFNSGVLFVRDMPDAHAFFNKWNALYIEYSSITTQDQPTLELTRELYPDTIHLMPDIYNTQALYTVRYIRHMKIMHYFSSIFAMQPENKDICIFSDPHTAEMIKAAGDIPEELTRLVAAPEQALLQSAFIFPPTPFFKSYLFRLAQKLFRSQNNNILIKCIAGCLTSIFQKLRWLKRIVNGRIHNPHIKDA